MSKSNTHFEGGVLSSNSGHAQLGPFITTTALPLPVQTETQTATAVAKENGQLRQQNIQLRQVNWHLRQRLNQGIWHLRQQLIAAEKALSECAKQKAVTEAGFVSMRVENHNLKAQRQRHLDIIRKFGRFAAKEFACESYSEAKSHYEYATGVQIQSKSPLWEQLRRSCREYRKIQETAALESAVCIPRVQRPPPQPTLLETSSRPRHIQTHSGSKRRLVEMQTTNLPVSSEPMTTTTKRRTVQRTTLSPLNSVLPTTVQSDKRAVASASTPVLVTGSDEQSVANATKDGAVVTQSEAVVSERHSSTDTTSGNPTDNETVVASGCGSVPYRYASH